jgi:hypothetical protein
MLRLRSYHSSSNPPQGFRADRYFDALGGAKQFPALREAKNEARKGKEIIFKIIEEEHCPATFHLQIANGTYALSGLGLLSQATPFDSFRISADCGFS